MMKYNFLPMGYRDNVDARIRKKFYVYLVILLFFLGIYIIKYFINASYISELDKSIENNIYERIENKKNSKSSDKDKNETIYVFNRFKDSILKNFSIEDIYINKKTISLQVQFLNVDNLTSFIKYLEQNQEYKIKKLDLENNEKGAVKLKIDLEEKRNDAK